MSPFIPKQKGGNLIPSPQNDRSNNDRSNRDRKELNIAFENDRSISEVSQEHEDESHQQTHQSQSHPSQSNNLNNSERASDLLPKKRVKKSPSSGRRANSRHNKHSGHRHSRTIGGEDPNGPNFKTLDSMEKAKAIANQTTLSAAANTEEKSTSLNKNPVPAHNNYLMNLSNQFSQ